MKKTGSLKAALEKLGNSKKVLRVGFLETAKYDNAEGEALPVAQVAYWNEYGAIINVPARKQTIYRSLNEKTGNFNRNGKFVKRDKSNFASEHDVPAHTIKIPPRPFFRKTIAENSSEWGKQVAQLLKANNYDADAALNELGDHIKGQLTESILSYEDPPNAPSTIRKKGFNAPLRDTGTMARSIDYEVTDDES